MENPITIYPAAALFCGRETLFNVTLAEKLEKIGYHAFLPQRDGFEFGNLEKSLKNKIPDKEISTAVQQIIYILDIGFFIPRSNVILANLDEPQDEGVMVELSYARLMGKLNIGYRTDVRSPYGNISDPLGGIHFFPAFQCDVFLRQYIPAKTRCEADLDLNRLVKKIDIAIKKKKGKLYEELSEMAIKNHNIERILSFANLLFDDFEDRHSEKGLETISKRYAKHKEEFLSIYPIIA